MVVMDVHDWSVTWLCLKVCVLGDQEKWNVLLTTSDSVKWVGLFAVAMVGVYTLDELWGLFGDPQLSVPVYAAHWVARAITLIAVPMVVYVASFKAHFTVLNKSGPGDNQMSSLFQAQLEGNKFGESPLGM